MQANSLNETCRTNCQPRQPKDCCHDSVQATTITDGYAGSCEAEQNPLKSLRFKRARQEENVYGNNPGEAARIDRGMAGCCLMDMPGCGWS